MFGHGHQNVTYIINVKGNKLMLHLSNLLRIQSYLVKIYVKTIK